MLNNNQNTTYNFGGGDVVNNNPVTNNIYLTRTEVRAFGRTHLEPYSYVASQKDLIEIVKNSRYP